MKLTRDTNYGCFGSSFSQILRDPIVIVNKFKFDNDLQETDFVKL